MKCSTIKSRISPYLDHELADDEALEIAKHLEGCDTCRKEHQALQDIDSILNELPEIAVSDAFHRKLEKSLNRQQHQAERRVHGRRSLFSIKTAIESILLSILKRHDGQDDVLEEFYDLPPNSMGRIYFKLF